MEQLGYAKLGFQPPLHPLSEVCTASITSDPLVAINILFLPPFCPIKGVFCFPFGEIQNGVFDRVGSSSSPAAHLHICQVPQISRTASAGVTCF